MSERSCTATAIVAWVACVACAPAVADESLSRSRLDGWLESSEWLFGREGLSANQAQRIGTTYAVMGFALAALEIGARPPQEARWEGDNGFDSAIRDVIMGGSRSARSSAATASDVLVGGLGLLLLLDRISLRHENPVLKSLLLDGSWLLTNEVVTEATKLAAGRERPYVDPCDADSDYVSDCNGRRDGNTSFFSGHSSGTATMAGLVCSHRLHRSASGSLDWIVCGGAAAASVATGMLRVTAEQHHATDVIAGWASGLLFGYILPTHFDRRIGAATPGFSFMPFHPTAGREIVGLRLEYSF